MKMMVTILDVNLTASCYSGNTQDNNDVPNFTIAIQPLLRPFHPTSQYHLL